MQAGRSSPPSYRAYLYRYEVRVLAPLARQALHPDRHTSEAAVRLVELYADYAGLHSSLIRRVVDAVRSGAPVPVRVGSSIALMNLEDV